ncbi:hypothetical protein DENIS_0436 [Desulfonema ishimotonii]|uniref:STAS domain-containing protein n=1 Tax=Desulfonema ishimotonii TaxID=45657 RepID=A0A401FRB1_9BACT|nr:hypothetical protein [Desulfonema ishimotonii]GBC59497.1 hypothetical protein DENIS_0436 [Desulfonema ishimotonii]
MSRMNIDGKGYKIDFDGRGSLKISGKLAAMPEEYEAIEDFFERVFDAIAEADTSELVLDVRDLTFLNSSGIKTICVSLVMEADDIEGLHMKIFCSASVTWQVETIPTFKDLMDNLKIIFE